MALKSQAKPMAPGGPGIEPRWTRGAKVAVGTAYTARFSSIRLIMKLRRAPRKSRCCDRAAISRGRLLRRMR